jgi:8-hydroxy-5-deazaflavin:NADPH oxidoreductase
MNIGVLGTGMVGEAIASKLVQLGHAVKMGSRSAANEKGAAWAAKAGPKASVGTFSEAAAFGEILFVCTKGDGTLDALKAAGEKNLNGKVVIDISNPLDFSKGMPPSLFISNTDSLGETIQRTFPGAKVVKSLNTTNCNIMVQPSLVPGDHDVFMSGNDAGAKAKVKEILTQWFGWKHVIDLGDITTARGTEQLLPIWVRLMGAFQTANFNFHIVRK